MRKNRISDHIISLNIYAIGNEITYVFSNRNLSIKFPLNTVPKYSAVSINPTHKTQIGYYVWDIDKTNIFKNKKVKQKKFNRSSSYNDIAKIKENQYSKEINNELDNLYDKCLENRKNTFPFNEECLI